MKSIFLSLMLASQALMAHAAGTIAFGNGALTRVQWYQGGGTTVPVPTTAQVVYGVFWGTNRDELTLVQPLGTSSTTVAGLIVAPSVYAIPGTEAGQTVFMQIKGWSSAYGTNWLEAKINYASYGETDIRLVTLGPETGPGTVIWGTGTNPNRFTLTLGLPLTPPAYVMIGLPPNTLSTVVDEGSQGTVDVNILVTRHSTVFPGTPNSLNFTTTVLLSTTNMTALAGEDYVPTNILVTFAPGEIEKTVRIKVTSDALPEPNEQFGLRLSAVSFVAIGTDVFVVTIREARVVSVRREAAQAVVSIQTTGSQRYALESSVDLLSWSLVPGAENIAGTGGIVQVADSSQDCCGTRFYRTQILP